MPPPRRGRLRLAALAWLCGLFAGGAALERQGALFLNIGAGDAAFARGFRGGWERDGLRGSGETMFRWTLDGSRLELPVSVLSGRVSARIRAARFAPGTAEVTVLTGGVERDRWQQPSQGWRVREVDLGEASGPLTLTFRSHSGDPDGLGVALDWMEVTGAGWIVPRPGLWTGLAVLIFVVPLLAGLFFRSKEKALWTGVIVLAVSTLAIALDRLGGLVALSRAGIPCLVALATTGMAARAIGRAWPDLLDKDGARAAAVIIPTLVALAHPFYYYPDVDTHARYLAAARSDPRLLVDPGDYQTRTGAWTREVGGRRVAFPYSPAFHVLAWPPAVVLGEERALKAMAAGALGVTLLLVHALARCLGAGRRAALLAQALFILLPVTASRLVLALYPTLLAQALELLLIVFLARAEAEGQGERSDWTLALLLVVCQAAYTGSLLNVGVLVPILAALEAASGERHRALRILGLYALATLAVLTLQYARFLPVLWRDVLPHAAETKGSFEAAGPGVMAQALHRLGLFYDVVYPLLLIPGLLAIRAADPRARRVAAAVLLAGGALLVLRYAVPVVFRDAKEVELLAGPVSALAAGGAAWLSRRGPLPRAAGILAILAAAVWGATRAVLAYADRFVAVGR
jgi:hypothetical protein